MITQRIIPLIMCGGSGTRLWPASREGRPKQFIPLFGKYSTFQDTLRRVSNPGLFGRPIIVTNLSYRFLVREQLDEIGLDADVLLEPVKKDSGPAIAAGTAYAERREPGATIIALAADHVITDETAFIAACRAGLSAVLAGRIVTFGIKPEAPSTEYGYIKPEPANDGAVLRIERFVEKPDLATAQRYVSEGYLWNSGNFMFQASTLLNEYRELDARSVSLIESAVAQANTDIGFVVLDMVAFEAATASSIDYAVMEKTSRASVIAVSYGWSDVGSWRAVRDLMEKDANGNATRGSVVFQQSHNCSVSTDRALVALQGVDNLIVVATQDAILVTKPDAGGGMKSLVAQLSNVAPSVTEDHINIHRPWGSYQMLDSGARHQVKRIVVKPGGRLSLQKHHHRSEHWIVVSGTAQVIIGEQNRMIHVNESIYIPAGVIHRLENPGKILLELIEVQTGNYFGEDDIIRIEDDYHR